MLANAFLFKKPDKSHFTFIVISLFYSTINKDVKKFVISVLPDTRSITTADRYPSWRESHK